MDPLQLKLTAAGLAAIVVDDSPALGPAQITQIGLTDTAFTPAGTLTAIPGEFKRLSVSGKASSADTLHITATDGSDDVYTYRGFGIYLADGTLFASYSQDDPIAGKAAVSASLFVLDVKLLEGQTANITFGDANFLYPPATTTRQGVVELATATEAKAGTDNSRALTPATGKAALEDWLGHAVADFALLAGFEAGSNANGYWRKTPDSAGGVIIEQWGTANAGEPWSGALTFPMPFADLASINLQVTSRSANASATSGNKVQGEVLSTTQFQVGSDDGSVGVFWRAIGREEPA